MTEAEWLACDDPREMLDGMPSTASERKSRLLSCAFLRGIGPFKDDRLYASVALAERWADGAATEADVRAFQGAEPTVQWAALVQPAHVLLRLCANALGDAWRLVPDLLREGIGNPFCPAAFVLTWRTPTVEAVAQVAYDYRALPSGHLDLARLAVLSDALEEAGCTDADILSHLRSPGPHVRGCWALDLILARS